MVKVITSLVLALGRIVEIIELFLTLLLTLQLLLLMVKISARLGGMSDSVSCHCATSPVYEVPYTANP
jgi:hypothetical protein